MGYITYGMQQHKNFKLLIILSLPTSCPFLSERLIFLSCMFLNVAPSDPCLLSSEFLLFSIDPELVLGDGIAFSSTNALAWCSLQYQHTDRCMITNSDCLNLMQIVNKVHVCLSNSLLLFYCFFSMEVTFIL